MLDHHDPAPDFSLPRLTGGQVSLSELLQQGPVLLAVYHVSCPVCQLTFPFLERLSLTTGFQVYGVSQDPPDATRRFNEQFEVTFPTLMDSEEAGYPVSNAFRVTNVPSLFLIEPDGLISLALSGFDKKALESLALRGNVPVFHPGERIPDYRPG